MFNVNALKKRKKKRRRSSIAVRTPIRRRNTKLRKHTNNSDINVNISTKFNDNSNTLTADNLLNDSTMQFNTNTVTDDNLFNKSNLSNTDFNVSNQSNSSEESNEVNGECVNGNVIMLLNHHKKIIEKDDNLSSTGDIDIISNNEDIISDNDSSDGNSIKIAKKIKHIKIDKDIAQYFSLLTNNQLGDHNLFKFKDDKTNEMVYVLKQYDSEQNELSKYGKYQIVYHNSITREFICSCNE